MDLANKRVVVTGGAGFLGGYVVEELRLKGCREIFVPRSREYDLTDIQAVRRLYEVARPQVVIHLASLVGGIGANREHPGEFFYKNLMMGVQMMEEGRLHGLEKFVAVGTICSYPKFTPTPFKEEHIWDGYPEETNAPYGLAKKMLLVQAQAYRQEYGFNAIYLLPVNLYGPGDNFDLRSAHVIPSLIRKAVEAKRSGAAEMVCWGTGRATREFLYVADCARGIVLATERYDGVEPINLGSGVEISIRELTNLVVEGVGFKGAIRWDTTKPDGQPRRCLDVERAWKSLGFRSEVPFAVGLKRTIDWYLERAV